MRACKGLITFRTYSGAGLRHRNGEADGKRRKIQGLVNQKENNGRVSPIANSVGAWLRSGWCDRLERRAGV